MSNRIGILTFHHTTNYGATLQAWALQNYLIQLGISSEIIDYQPSAARSTYRRVLFYNRRFLIGLKKMLNFKHFRRRHLSLSSETLFDLPSLQTVVAQYDTVIFGSDEIWNTSSFRGYDAGFFLGFPALSHIRKFSYAASAGSTVSFGDKKNVIAAALNKFTAVSVRDKSTQSLLSNECGVVSETMVDPTLLVDFSDLISQHPKQREDYVLIYGSLNAIEQRLVIDKAKELNCRIFSVGEFNRCADKNFLSAGIQTWLELFNGAQVVFTSFYHGAIFAWKLSRPLIVFERPSKIRKIKGFVEELALKSTLLPMGGDDDAVAVAYESSTQTLLRLEAAISKAERFLRNVEL
ncbi:polysaccharide pyruvyl transferase family protein [Thalassospira lucentensis]|uniref:polysaccharide pyruvyl transferase family protein n=1 Tax=Thalassospira lucentensis TaxID=168935 RepID=UPI00399D6BED